MSVAMGNIEDVAAVNAAGQAVEPIDTTLRYDRAKAELRSAEVCGVGLVEATEEFVAAREALRSVLETIWPGQRY